ncbi:MAG: hypothetical protein IPH45_20645 [Bacteroidales bacterium]|nr:hypothetical protein [Bacteroidales bacterium]
MTNDLGLITRVNTVGNGGDVNVSYGGFDAWLLKINSLGSIDWDFTLGTEGADFGGSPIQTSDNGYLIPLMCNPGSNGNILCDPNLHSTSIGRAVIVKLDSARNIEWQQCMGATDHIGFTNALEVNDGYIIGDLLLQVMALLKARDIIWVITTRGDKLLIYGCVKLILTET